MANKALPLLLMAAGLLSLTLGLGLLIARLTDPEGTAALLPGTATAIPPTAGYLGTPLSPPDRAADIPIMPVMAVGGDIVFLPPTLTSTPTQTSSPTATVPHPTATRTKIVTQAAPGDPPTRTPTATITPSATLTSTLTPTPTLTPIPRQPDRILIPAISVDAPVLSVWLQRVMLDGQVYSQWRVPEGWAVGWHETSAMLGQIGNTVLNGHHNIEGRVFRRLVDVQPGDKIILVAQDGTRFEYVVAQTMLLAEEGQPIEQRLENARWLLPSNDERITLVTCWPPTGRSHRLVVVALPSD